MFVLNRHLSCRKFFLPLVLPMSLSCFVQPTYGMGRAPIYEQFRPGVPLYPARIPISMRQCPRKTLIQQRREKAEFVVNMLMKIPPVEETNEKLKKWKTDVLERTVERNLIISRANNLNDTWTNEESIMRPKITVNYLKSINRLENRYPFAIPRTNYALFEVYRFVLTFDPSTHREIGFWKKQAALRFLDRVLTQFSHDNRFRYDYGFNRARGAADPNRSGLSVQQIISLVWAAIQDHEVYPNLLEMEDRKWGLIETFAFIQRAYNEAENRINFNYQTERDRPCCPNGIFKRLIEQLEGTHPDVELSVDLSKMDDFGSFRRITREMVGREVQKQHESLFENLSLVEKKLIQESLQSRGEEYLEYVENLRQQVHFIAPAIPYELIVENSNEWMMEALFDRNRI